MQRLAPTAYDRVVPLVPASDVAGHMTFVRAVLEGRMAGEVFADDAAAPATAFACTGSGLYFALGVPRAELVEPWLEALAAALPSDEPPVLFATTGAWQAALDPLFTSRIARTEYRFAGFEPHTAVDAPFGYQLVRLDVEAAAALAPGIDPWVFRIWGGVEAFLEGSFGFGLVAGVRVVSLCAACAIGGGEAEVEVQTASAFRERGLAGVVARALLRECAVRGLRPAWTAEVGNEPSHRLARSLGFQPLRDVTGYPLSTVGAMARVAVR